MIEDELPRGLSELTGRHRCIGCLADVPSAEYFANDYICRACAAKGESFPLASTPGVATQAPEAGGSGGGGSP